jgi:cytochrome c biogenesis protein
MSDSATFSPPQRRTPVWSDIVDLLSSMRFAIALLTVICIASVVGTVVRQGEPLNNYINQFGPFWADVFGRMSLFSVYSAWWFLLILAFLVTSTSLCIARNTPKIWVDVRTFKENMREQSLVSFHHHAVGQLVGETPADAAKRLGTLLATGSWKVKLQERPRAGASPGWMVAAKAGSVNKLGYIAAHSAIVLVCLGGLLDGDLIVRAQMWFNGKQVYQGGGLIADVPAQHRLSERNPTFRGNLLVAEGTQSSTAILSQPNGILLQELPFAIELRKFVIEHYSTGMPKLFASDIVIHDKVTGERIPARVEVNHPASHRGVEIYQSSFDDGGSSVKLQAVPLAAGSKPFAVEGFIGGSTQLSQGNDAAARKLTLEFTGLRVINVENMAGGSAVDPRKVDLRASLEARLGAANKPKTNKELRNVGPSVTYKLRDEAGQAREYHNYMLPIDMGDAAKTFLVGVRDTPAESFKYVRIPADASGSLRAFQVLNDALSNPQIRTQAVRVYAARAVDASKPELATSLAASAARAITLFAGEGGEGARKKGGLQAVADFIEANVPEAERNRAGEVLIRILNGVLFELTQQALQAAGEPPLKPGEEAQSFITQSVLALGDMAFYPAPMVFQLADFKQVQASVFQVARAPGKSVVYLGCALLILGVFAMLYVRERRIWIWVEPTEMGSKATLALSTNRKTMDGDQEFHQIHARLFPTTDAEVTKS